MTLHKPHNPVKLTPYASYDERGIALERCPNCQNEKISKTPRRKGGPTMYHCRRCGYLTNIDLVFDTHRLLCHRAA
ncbi:MAG: hypothetical protein O3B04_04535 [Chloroflexi bacterium]|nr:hypothetical protein [Chloroflexota bacterium]MDA1297257.1 hypothetical protein [Chloroflexota bacterium]